MRNLKKILSLALALVMVLSMMVTASAAFEDQDLINEKYAEAVAVMAELGILQGDGTNFNPDGTLTRAEAAVILSKVKSGPDFEKVIEKASAYVENPFSDVPAWAVPYVLYCYQEEIVGGVGGDKYNAKGTLRGYDFAKMLLIAAGFGVHEDYIGDATKTYETKVLEMAKEAELLNGLTITLSKAITREQASQMALNAMKAGMTSATTYDVYKGDQLVANFDNALDAYVNAQILGGEVKLNTSATGGLLADLWKVKYTPAAKGGLDNYGRTGDIYEFPATQTTDAYKLAFNVPAAYKTYTNDVAIVDEAKALKAGDLKGYAFVNDQVKVWEDGVYTVAADTVENVVAKLTGPNTVVEVYANSSKKVTSIVATNTYYEVAGEATVNNVKYATFGKDFKLPYSTSGLKKNDVVAYTMYNGELDTYTKLEGVKGTLSTVTSAGQYVVNGQYYGLDVEDAVAAHTELLGVMYAQLEMVYYIGANNTIVLYHAPDVDPVAPAPVYNNFALVKETGFIKTGETSTGSILNPGSSATYAGAIKLLLSDGKEVEMAIEILKAPATGVKVGTTTVVAPNAYYYVVGDKYETIDVTGVTATVKGELTALKDKIVAYENGAIAYASQTVAAGASGNVYAVLTDTKITTTTTTIGNNDIIVNGNTVIVHKVVNPVTGAVSYATVKGQASVGKGVDAKYVVYSTTYNATTKAYTNVALVVFAHESTLSFDTVAPETADYVWNSNYFTFSYDAYGAPVYTYSVLKTDGTWTFVETDAPLVQYCIYELLDNGEVVLVADENGQWKTGFGTIDVVSGNTIKVVDLLGVEGTSAWILTGAKTTVCGNIAVGSGAYYVDVNDDGLVDVMFIFAE